MPMELNKQKVKESTLISVHTRSISRANKEKEEFQTCKEHELGKSKMNKRS